MKTTFTIAADTTAKIVELRITQGKRKMYRRQFATVTDAALFLLDGIGTVMERRQAAADDERHELDSTYEIDGGPR
jgi:hypothetical protein